MAVYVIAKVAMSLDGYIDDKAPNRLILSHPQDMERVDRVRAQCDAILVGAQTIRADNPSLLIKSEEVKQLRRDRGLPDDLVKVTITRSGGLDSKSRFFQTGTNSKIVFWSSPSAAADPALAAVATIVQVGRPDVSAETVLAELKKRGVNTLLVEGGTQVSTMFLTGGYVDELHVAIAPFFIGDLTAPKWVNGGRYPNDKTNRMQVKSVEQVGDMVVAQYRLRRTESVRGNP